MINDLNEYLASIVIGITFNANFAIEDNIGSIVDKLLYESGSIFNSDIFTGVQSKNIEKKLITKDNSDNLVINNSNIVLEIFFGTYFKKNNLEKIIKGFNNDIVDGIIKKHDIKRISRIGYINRYKIKEPEVSKKFISKSISSKLDNIDEIHLRFSSKITDNNALSKRDVFDYNNVIYNVIKETESDDLFLSVDYQKYFEPPLKFNSEFKFLKFVKNVKNYQTSTILPWLNNNYVE